MKKRHLPLLALGVFLVAWVCYLKFRPEGNAALPSGGAQVLVAEPVLPPPEPPEARATVENSRNVEAWGGIGASFGAQGMSAEHECRALLDAMALYKDLHGELPPGDRNREWVAALQGKTGPQKAFNVLPAKHPRITEAGEIVDRNGVPFYFHPGMGGTVDVRQAGPDKQIWTEDDVMVTWQGRLSAGAEDHALRDQEIMWKSMRPLPNMGQPAVPN